MDGNMKHSNNWDVFLTVELFIIETFWPVVKKCATSERPRRFPSFSSFNKPLLWLSMWQTMIFFTFETNPKSLIKIFEFCFSLWAFWILFIRVGLLCITLLSEDCNSFLLNKGSFSYFIPDLLKLVHGLFFKLTVASHPQHNEIAYGAISCETLASHNFSSKRMVIISPNTITSSSNSTTKDDLLNH